MSVCSDVFVQSGQIFFRHFSKTGDVHIVLKVIELDLDGKRIGLHPVDEMVVILVFGVDANIPTIDAAGQHLHIGMGELGAIPVTCLIMAIGMSLGGATGYAINPARDLSPRIAHAILPMKGKRDSGWGYSWVPVAGPIVGAILAALTYLALY